MITGTPTNSKTPQTFTAKGNAVGQQSTNGIYSFKSDELQNTVQRGDGGDQIRDESKYIHCLTGKHRLNE